MCLIHLQWMAHCKSLLLFICGYLLFAHINSRRMDVPFGRVTLKWLQQAHDKVHLKPLDELDDTSSSAAMMLDGLPQVVDALQNMCDTCAVGLTSHEEDLRFLGLDSFVCSDFDSEKNTEAYPMRDCAVQDSQWARAPTSDTAPCCQNASLVKASIAIMAKHERTGLRHASLSSLSEDVEAAAFDYVERHVTRDQFLMQLIVSRRQRLAAAQYRADWVDRVAAPDKLATSTTFWSANYSIPKELAMLKALLLIILALTFFHDQRMQKADAAREALRRQRAEREGPSKKASDGELELRSRWYVLLIEIPSTIGPVVLEGARYVLDLPTWHFAVTCVEMLLSVRLFHDAAAVRFLLATRTCTRCATPHTHARTHASCCAHRSPPPRCTQVVPPMRRLVLVFSVALPNILAYIVSLAPLVVLTAVMHGQAFGLFDDGFADVPTGITRVVRYLTAPPPASRVEPENFEAIGPSDNLLYYWSTFTFRLAFGSFIVAILVGAFNNVVSREQARRQTTLLHSSHTALSWPIPALSDRRSATIVAGTRGQARHGARSAARLCRPLAHRRAGRADALVLVRRLAGHAQGLRR